MYVELKKFRNANVLLQQLINECAATAPALAPERRMSFSLDPKKENWYFMLKYLNNEVTRNSKNK
jgi:hypothetical protein